ncbi:hypothetical protein BHM03_00062030 [Ensete ventricosum]|nr:hypothetical protein BHM03_00062030 [Ensete ventricosum]
MCRLNLVLLVYTWMPGNSSLAPEGCANSLGCRLVDREPRWSPHARVNFWSFVELQSLRVCCDIPERVAYPRSEDVVWLASVGEASLFASALFRSSVGSPIVKASVGRWGHLDSAHPMIKLAMRSKGLECSLPALDLSQLRSRLIGSGLDRDNYYRLGFILQLLDVSLKLVRLVADQLGELRYLSSHIRLIEHSGLDPTKVPHGPGACNRLLFLAIASLSSSPFGPRPRSWGQDRRGFLRKDDRVANFLQPLQRRPDLIEPILKGVKGTLPSFRDMQIKVTRDTHKRHRRATWGESRPVHTDSASRLVYVDFSLDHFILTQPLDQSMPTSVSASAHRLDLSASLCRLQFRPIHTDSAFRSVYVDFNLDHFTTRPLG